LGPPREPSGQARSPRGALVERLSKGSRVPSFSLAAADLPVLRPAESPPKRLLSRTSFRCGLRRARGLLFQRDASRRNARVYVLASLTGLVFYLIVADRKMPINEVDGESIAVPSVH
jgi:hypothetical protein